MIFKVRNGIKYRKDGAIGCYKAFTYCVALVFIVNYDSLSRFSNYEGDPIHSWVQNGDYPIGKEFSMELLVAGPPHCKTEVAVMDWDIDAKQALSETRYTPDQFNRVDYSRTQNPEKGLYVLVYVCLFNTLASGTDIITFFLFLGKGLIRQIRFDSDDLYFKESIEVKAAASRQKV